MRTEANELKQVLCSSPAKYWSTFFQGLGQKKNNWESFQNMRKSNSVLNESMGKNDEEITTLGFMIKLAFCFQKFVNGTFFQFKNC